MNYIDLSATDERRNYKVDKIDDGLTLTNNSYGTENISSTSVALQDGGFFWNSKNDNDNKMLLAARTRDYNVVDFMLKNDMITNLGVRDNDGHSLLHYLARDYATNDASSSIVDNMLARNDVYNYINVKDNIGDTPLIAATKNGNIELCSKLELAGADKSIKNNDGLYVATETENMANVQQNVEQKEDLNNAISNMVNMFVNSKSLEPMSPYSSDMPSQLKMTEAPTEKTTSLATDVVGNTDTMQDTDAFVNSMLAKYVDNDMKGGSRNVRMGSRKLINYNRTSAGLDSISDYHFDLSRMRDSKSSKIHARVLEKIEDLLNVDLETARAYKFAIYYDVKRDMPELSNYDRAEEMEKRTTLDKLQSIDIDQVLADFKQHVEDVQKTNSQNSDKPKPEKKQTKDKKSKAKPEKSSKSKKSKTKKTSESAFSNTSENEFSSIVVSPTSYSDTASDTLHFTDVSY